jgi:Ca-activated chloride channel homolog
MRAADSLALAIFLLPGFACDARSQAEEPFRISVNLNLVVLQAAVHDRSGRFAPDLHEGDFAVYEDGVRQSIRLFRHEDIPVTVGLVVDHSGSMRPKLPWVTAAARTFVRSSSAEDQMFVVNFNEKVTVGLPGLGNRSDKDRPDELARAIGSQPALGKTALYDAVAAAFTGLRAGGPEKKVLIVISDGGDNASAHTLAGVLRTAEESSALIYTIGIFDEEDKDQNPDVLRRLARATGGEAFFPRQLEEVVSICESIAHDIRNQYTIGYVSNNAEKPGALRGIRVTAQTAGHGKLLVRTRSGYIAGGASQ